MIPKVIHYCWFGQGELSNLEKKCLVSWKKYCPDYKIKLWNEENFDVEFCEFTKEAYKAGKYAFVSDVARLYALEKYGGIYLDTDMFLIKAFPRNIIDSKVFFGKENSNLINAAVVGSEAENILIRDLLLHYKSIPFSEPLTLIPSVLTSFLAKVQERGFNSPLILKPEVFYPLPFKLRKFHWYRFITNETIGVHLWNASWHELDAMSGLDKIKYFISKYYVPTSFLKYAQKIR
jgi:mannosyltransferase OCH1-like enzyme